MNISRVNLVCIECVLSVNLVCSVCIECSASHTLTGRGTGRTLIVITAEQLVEAGILSSPLLSTF